MALTRNQQEEFLLHEIEDLVLSGGGMKGVTLLGLFLVLEIFSLTKKLKGVGGTSAGAYFSFGLCVGIHPTIIYFL